LLTVVHGRICCIPFADQLVRLVHAEVILVAVEALVVLLRPARVLVLLGILGGLLLPSLGRLAGLDRLVLLLGVTLLGHRYNCGINHLGRAVSRHPRRLRGALRPMTRDARLSALHRGDFGPRGRASVSFGARRPTTAGSCLRLRAASSSQPGRSAWRAGSRASRGQR